MLKIANDWDLMYSATSLKMPVAGVFAHRGERTYWLIEMTLETLARRMPEILILLIDSWENPEVTEKYGCGSPSLSLFVKGKHMGSTKEMGLTRLIDFIRGAIA